MNFLMKLTHIHKTNLQCYKDITQAKINPFLA